MEPAASALAGRTLLATLTFPAATAFGADAAVSPPASAEIPGGVLTVATDSLVLAARWAAEGLGIDPSIELGAAAGEGGIQGRAYDAMRLFMPAQVLGLAPGWAPDAAEEEQEGGNRGWKVTAAVSLTVTLTGYWYCNRTSTRRQGPPPRRPPVQRARRVYPSPHGERDLVAN